MSITAFPVLARLLADWGLTRTPLGVLALSAAAVDDAVAWCLLAFVVGVAQAEQGEALRVAAGAARPLFGRYVSRWDPSSPYAIASALVALGLMELIVLNIRLELGVISPRLFSMMVLMALATTMSTAPLLKALGGRATVTV